MSAHLIHTQRIEANFKSKEAALSGQKVLHERFTKILVPIMEQLFDEYNPKGRSLRIDKLELDLGRFPADLPENMMRDRLRDVLENQLRKNFLEQGIHMLPPQEKTATLDHSTDQNTIHSDWEIIRYYLSQGRLPWWASSNRKESIQTVFDRLTTSSELTLTSWLKSTSISLTMAQRLTVLMSERMLENLFKNSLQLSKEDIQAVRALLELLLSSKSIKKTELRFWLNIALLYSTSGTRNSVSTYLESGFKSIKKADRKAAEQTSKFLYFLSFFILKNSEGSSLSSGLIQLETTFFQSLKNLTFTFSGKDKSIFSTNLFWKEVAENLENKKVELKDFPTFSKEIIQLAQQEERYLDSKSPALNELQLINNAGLVLVAVFLPRFFENLGLVKSGKFLSVQAQIKAVFLLQEMLANEQEYDEADLLLNKLLCGVPPAAALGLTPKITTAEMEEIASLLESMATQWTALKSTSGKMIAEGFFRREGALRRVQRGYQLQIQRLPFDLLLDRLPWTIGMIKLPWMDELISVEW